MRRWEKVYRCIACDAPSCAPNMVCVAGSHSIVFSGEMISATPHISVAVKLIPLDNGYSIEDFEREVRIQSALGIHGIMPCVYSAMTINCGSRPCGAIVMERMRDTFNRVIGKLSANMAGKLRLRSLELAQEMCDLGFVSYDLHDNNIMVANDGRVVFVDAGGMREKTAGVRYQYTAAQHGLKLTSDSLGSCIGSSHVNTR